MLSDLRYALRSLLKSPGFTIVAVITLALGIGATTAIYSVVHAVALKPLPYPESGQILAVHVAGDDGRTPAASSVSPPDYRDLQREATVFTELAAWHSASVNLTGQGEPRRLRAQRVTANYWQVFGLPPLLGRVFTAETNRPGADTVAVLSHGLWQQEFGGDPTLPGRTVQFDGIAVTVIGIMPPDFQAGDRAELWLPMALSAEQWGESHRGTRFLRVLGRLKPGLTPAAAQAEMTLLGRRLAAAHPDTHTGASVRVQPLLDLLVGDLRPVLYTLLGAVGALLLIACVNVANLLLARASARRREISVRAALGARPARIVRQMLTESVVLAVVGGLGGVLIAYWGVDALLALAPAGVPRLTSVTIDGTVLAVTAGTILLCGLLFGLAPAWQAGRINLVGTLKDGGRTGGGGPRQHRLRQGLVVVEIALALTLLISATLLMQSFLRLLSSHPGYRTDSSYTFGLSLPAGGYPDAAAQVRFTDQLLEQLRALPGVQSAGLVHTMPLAGDSWRLSYKVSGQESLPANEWSSAGYFMISPDYLQAMGIPLLSGRAFTAADRAGAPPVALISRSLAERHFPGENPVGKRIHISNTEDDVWREIVGVVGDIRHRTLDADFVPQMYEPFAQQGRSGLGIVVHAPHAPAGFAATLKQSVHALDPSLPLVGLGPIEQLVERSVAQRRFFTLLLASFTVIALVLAGVGIYGVMAYNVSQRTTEYGVRLALGATPAAVRRLVLQRGGVLVALGFALGLVAAVATGRLLASLLFAVSPFEPGAYLAALGIFGLIAFLACWFPARRATRTDPVVALRAE